MPDSRANSPRLRPPDSRGVEGTVVSPGRWRRGTGLFSDETLRKLEILLDEAFRIPFTRIRFGIDGIIGLFPGLGDVIAGILSLIIPIGAWVRGVPYVTIMRMAANLCIGVLIGSIPILGDAFDIAWKTNAAIISSYNVIWASRVVTPGRIGYFFSCWRRDRTRIRYSDPASDLAA